MLSKSLREMAARQMVQGRPSRSPLHPPTNDCLSQWEALYPPRCLSPGESVEDHLRYAGVVEFLKDLRDAYNRTADFSVHRDVLKDVLSDTSAGITTEREVF